ncbi:PLDc N-terminal domain-containing protein [Desulfonema magnum]|uniref:Phospholipase N-terminal domain-containing protein n=1 Tax=Desulfonema magnum TaxID=45655 RepID=A0A975GMI2_9BACT|nr:PLDc N-terminal domain-containing protein [Desulfonema magnum]QTA85873.1 Phospholipase N-terminal domain-containing protein [Desulfonema magnum]
MNTVTITIIGIGVLFFLMTCWAILDIAKKDFGKFEKKLLWGFVAASLPFIGVIIYIVFGYRKGQKSET